MCRKAADICSFILDYVPECYKIQEYLMHILMPLWMQVLC